MSFPLTEPQTVMLVLAIGSAVYAYAMIRESVNKFKVQPTPTAEGNLPSAPPPPPPPPSTNASTEQKQHFHTFLNAHPRVKKLLHIEDTPIDKKLRQIVTVQRQQAEHFEKLEARVEELKFAVAMKPEPTKPKAKTTPTHISSPKREPIEEPARKKRKPTEDAKWRKEQEDK